MIPSAEQWEQFHAENPAQCYEIASTTMTRCQRPRANWLPEAQMPDPYRCRWHLSGEQRAALEDAWEVICPHREAERAYDEWATLASPACWSWEPPDMDRWEEYRDTLPEVARHTLSKEICHEALLKRWHAGRCAICAWDKERLVTDHDHETGWVRGWLCRSCNVKEGNTPGGVWEKYRQRNPGVICDVQVMYISPYTGLPWIPRTPQEIEAAEKRAEEEANWRVLRRRGR